MVRWYHSKRHLVQQCALASALQSWRDMGQAQVSCTGDCSCEQTVVDGMSKDLRFKVS
jgi:hypothetical protein